MRQTQKSLPELSERLFSRVGVAGFEPTTPCSQSRCANRTALHPVVPDLDPVIGLVQPREAVVCQSRAFRPGEPSGFRVAKITAFFRSGKLLPRNPPFPAACRIPVGRGCLFACRTVFCRPVFQKQAAFPDMTLPRSVCVAFRLEPCGLRICPVAALPPGIPDGAAISLRLSLPTGVRNPHPVRACTPRTPAPAPRPHSSARRR